MACGGRGKRCKTRTAGGISDVGTEQLGGKHSGGGEHARGWWGTLQTGAILFYCAVGPALIFLNKHLLSTTGFKHPAFLSGLGVVFSSVISFLLIKVFGFVKQEHKDDMETKFYLTRVMPIGFSLAGTLAAGNLAYLYLSVSFIQVNFVSHLFLSSLEVVVADVEGIRPCDTTEPTLRMPNGKAEHLADPKYCDHRFWYINFCLRRSRIQLDGAFGDVFIRVLRIYQVGPLTPPLTFFSCFSPTLNIVQVCMQILLSNFKFSVIEGLYYMAPAATFWLFLYSLIMEDVTDAVTRIRERRNARDETRVDG